MSDETLNEREDRLIEIESRLAYQDQLLIELNDALVKQQDSIMSLEQLCASMAERLRALGEPGGAAADGNETPPHY